MRIQQQYVSNKSKINLGKKKKKKKNIAKISLRNVKAFYIRSRGMTCVIVEWFMVFVWVSFLKD